MTFDVAQSIPDQRDVDHPTTGDVVDDFPSKVPELTAPEPLGMEKAPNVDVAGPREPETLGGCSNTPARFRHRQRLVVERANEVEKPRVVTRR